MPVSESFPVRGSMLGAGFLTATLLLAVIVLDKGEVVQLITRDPAGQRRETQLWIAELDGHAYFRAGDSGAGWLTRLQSNASATLERNGRAVEIETFVEDEPQVRERLDRAMAQKYGLADRIWGFLRSPDCVPIRIRSLEPGVRGASVGSQGARSARVEPE